MLRKINTSGLKLFFLAGFLLGLVFWGIPRSQAQIPKAEAAPAPDQGDVGAKESKEKDQGTVHLVNAAKDIHVLSDKKESVLEFFQRHHIIVAGTLEYAKIRKVDKTLPKFMFSGYSSHNDDEEKTALFGSIVNLAPLSAQAKELVDARWKEGKERMNLAMVLRRDAQDPALYHPVGFTDRTPVGFFERKEKNEKDGFSQEEMKFKGK